MDPVIAEMAVSWQRPYII